MRGAAEGRTSPDRAPNRCPIEGRGFPWTVSVFFILVLGQCAYAQEFKAHTIQLEGEIREVKAGDLESDGWKEMAVTLALQRDRKIERYLHVYGFSGKGSGTSLQLRHVWGVAPDAVFWDLGPDDGAQGGSLFYFLSQEGLSELREDGREGLVPKVRIGAPVALSTGQEDEFPWLDVIRDWDDDGRLEALLPSGREARFYRQSGGGEWEMVDAVRLAPFAYYNNDTLFGRKVGSYDYLAVLLYPVLEPVDLNGDGRKDLLALQNGRGLCFLRKASGQLDPEPALWDVDIRSGEERIRRRAVLSYRVAELNRDGCADVVVHKVGMQFVSWSAETAVFLGRPDGNRPAEPDHRFPSRGFLSGVSVEDLDGDGYDDMTLWSLKMGLWPMVEILLKGVVHLNAKHYYGKGPQGFSAKAAAQRDFELRIDSDRPDLFRGLVPSTEGDFNGDGLRDLVAGNGEGEIAIYLGRPGRGFEERPWATVPVSGVNYVRAEDVDGNGLCDLYGCQVEKGFSRLHVWLQERVP